MENSRVPESALTTLYKFPSRIRHWDGKPAVLDPTRLVLSLKPEGKGGPAYDRKRVKKLVEKAGMRLVDTGFREYRRRRNQEALSGKGELGAQVKADLEEIFRKAGKTPKHEPDDFPASNREALPPPVPVNESDCEFFVETLDERPINTQQLTELEQLFGDDWDWIGPVYDREPGSDRASMQSRFCPFPRSLSVELFPDLESGQLEKILIQEDLVLEKPLAQEKPARFPTLTHLFFKGKGGKREHVYLLRDQLRLKYPKVFRSLHFENMPMLSPQHMGWNFNKTNMFGAIPSDPPVSDQPGGWPQVVPVVVIDRGVDFHNNYGNIPQDIGNFNHWNAKYYVPSDGAPVAGDPHGTHCAGIIAESTGFQLGMTTAPQGHPVMAIVVPNFTDKQVGIAISHCANHLELNAHGFVINLSASDSNAWDPRYMTFAIEQIAGNGNGVLCVSVGNNSRDSVNYPANQHSVISVAASDTDDIRVAKPKFTWGTNHGPQVATYAPGVGIVTLGLDVPGAVEGSFNMNFGGTSAAAPHVSALASMIIRKCRNIGITYNWFAVKHRIAATGDTVYNPSGVPIPNTKRINAGNALNFFDQGSFDSP